MTETDNGVARRRTDVRPCARIGAGGGAGGGYRRDLELGLLGQQGRRETIFSRQRGLTQAMATETNCVEIVVLSLLALGGHPSLHCTCPLSGVKRT
jgi:hypothetical protein